MDPRTPAMLVATGAPAALDAPPDDLIAPPRPTPRPRLNGRFYITRLLRAEMTRIAREHLSTSPRSRLIDFGCGAMPYRSLLEPMLARYVGVDLPSNERADAHLEADGATPLPGGSADVVLSTQVLEHVDDPPAYLRESRRILGEEGILILSTHGTWRYHPHPADYWRWTSAGLRRLLEENGFRVTDFRGLMGPACTGLLLLQDAVVRRLPRWIRTPVAVAFQTLGMLADRLHPQAERDEDAAVYVIVARRKRVLQ